MNKKKEMKIKHVRNGTVIDHIEPGMALKVVRILGIPEPDTCSGVSIGMFVNSKKMGMKDIVKIEDRELKKKEVNKISLIAPDASIIIIKDFEVKKKTRVALPKTVKEIVRCKNPNCITNKKEPVTTEFVIEKEPALRLRCSYCDRYVADIEESLV